MIDKQTEKEIEKMPSDKSKAEEIKSTLKYGEVEEKIDPGEKDVDEIVQLKQNEELIPGNEQDIDDLVHRREGDK
ncbi:MAG: hypothetical protein WKF35_08105 [Ferruginibacter sp.]